MWYCFQKIHLHYSDLTELHTGLDSYENVNIFKVVFVLIVNITFNVVNGRISTFIAL